MHSSWEVQPGDVLPWLSMNHQTSMGHRGGNVPCILLRVESQRVIIGTRRERSTASDIYLQ